jgi:hypothetical protein
MGRSHFAAVCEDDHRPAQLGRDRHGGGGVAGGGGGGGGPGGGGGGGGGGLVFHPRARGSPAGIAIPFIVVPAHGDRGTFTVVIPRTVATGRRNPAVVLIHGSRVWATGGTGPVRVADGTFLKALNLGNGERRILRVRARLGAYIGDAGDARSFELSLVQFLHGGLEIVGGFEFHKPCDCVNGVGVGGVLAGIWSPTLGPVRGLSQSTPRPVRTGGQSLSSPR